MKHTIRTTLLAAAALTLFVAPALAESAICTVTASELRLRKSPSKKSSVVAVLKKDARITAEGKCSGGWVKVSSEDGRLSGYVGGWALSEAAPKTASTATSAAPEKVTAVTAAPARVPVSAPAPIVVAAPAPAPVAVAAPAPTPAPIVVTVPVAVRREVPTNEQLAVQITQLRLSVLGLDRDMDKMNKEIQKIKVQLTHKGAKKGHKHAAKKG